MLVHAHISSTVSMGSHREHIALLRYVSNLAGLVYRNLTDSDALKQAMEMRALIVVADVSGPADLAGLKEAVLEELALNRLVVIMHTPKEVPGGETAAAGPTLPKALLDRSACWDLTDIGFYLSDLKLAHRPCKDILRRLRLRDEATEHYSLVSSVHLGSAIHIC